METIGEALRSARHNKKASLEDAARTTKIKVEILEKLESDDFAALAGPMYTKGFLKLYAEYLGLDSTTLVNAYLKSQGGLRRQGLQMETEANLRARRQRELQLPLGSVIRVVAGLTVAVGIGFGVYYYIGERKKQVANPPKSQGLPVADFEAFYQPKTKPAPELLEPPTK